MGDGNDSTASTVAPERAERLRANLAAVRERIAAACERAGRDAASVTLVAVTKTASAGETQVLVDAGCTDLGENRIQVAAEKIPIIQPGPSGVPVTWHMIAHLQRNKAKQALELFGTLHSLDTAKLADRLDRLAEEADRTVDVWCEVNVAGEEQKEGVAPEAAAELVEHVAGLPRLRLRGLMTMAPYDAPDATLRTTFATLRELRDRLATEAVPLPDLSMGMTNDFELAIAEGATHVRIGSALFRE